MDKNMVDEETGFTNLLSKKQTVPITYQQMVQKIENFPLNMELASAKVAHETHLLFAMSKKLTPVYVLFAVVPMVLLTFFGIALDPTMGYFGNTIMSLFVGIISWSFSLAPLLLLASTMTKKSNHVLKQWNPARDISIYPKEYKGKVELQLCYGSLFYDTEVIEQKTFDAKDLTESYVLIAEWKEAIKDASNGFNQNMKQQLSDYRGKQITTEEQNHQTLTKSSKIKRLLKKREKVEYREMQKRLRA